MMDQVGQPGGPLADASVWHLEVTQTGALTPNLYRLLLTAPGLGDLRYDAGQDLMLRVPQPGDRIVNRRYTIRRLDPAVPAVTLDISVHGKGPGTEWIRSAEVGSRIDAIGPRGKITAQHGADWHLFIADDTGLPGSLAMMEALPVGAVALALLEIDSPADEQSFEADQLARLDVRWLHRLGHSEPGDPSPLLGALGATRFPAGRGHVYVAAELRVVRALQRSLGERGLAPDQISAKAYWKRGLPNAEHGEPAREE
jgi:NADPH-dependent ferric siderophore reductase